MNAHELGLNARELGLALIESRAQVGGVVAHDSCCTIKMSSLLTLRITLTRRSRNVVPVRLAFANRS